MLNIKFIPIVLFILLIVRCGSKSDMDQPPTVRYGEDSCDECHMLINEARFAAAYVARDGQNRRFDDLGCMLKYQAKHQEKVHTFWVTDYQTEKWLSVNNAILVKSDQIKTPMGHGIVAVESQKSAETILHKKEGSLLSFEQLLNGLKQN